MTKKSSKTDLAALEAFKAEIGTTTTAEFVSGPETVVSEEPETPAADQVVYPAEVTRENIASRFAKANGPTGQAYFRVNPKAARGRPHILQMTQTTVDEATGARRTRTILDIPRAMLNLLESFADPNSTYEKIVVGATLKVDLEVVDYMTVIDNAIYSDGRWLNANGIGTFPVNGLYTTHIRFGQYYPELMTLVAYDKTRVAELNKTTAGIRQARLEETHRNMIAKFLAGQFLVKGNEYVLFPMFFAKDDDGKWTRDLDRLEATLSSYALAIGGDAAAIEHGRIMYATKIVLSDLRQATTSAKAEDAMPAPEGKGEKKLPVYGANGRIVYVAAMTLVGRELTLSSERFADISLHGDERLLFADIAAMHDGVFTVA